MSLKYTDEYADELLDDIMARLLAEQENNMQSIYDEVYSDVNAAPQQELGQAEQQRILQSVLRRIGEAEEENVMSAYSNNNNNNDDKIKVYRLGHKRWLTFGLAAVLMLAMSSLALAEFGLAPDFLGFFNADGAGAGSLHQSGQEIMQQASDNGATLTVEQVVGDRYSVYVLLDFVAPEGVVLDKEVYEWGQPWVDAKGSSGCGYHFVRLPDDDPTDNHIRMMLCLSASSSLQGDTLNLNFRDLKGYSVADQEYKLAVEGNWQLSFKLDYAINSQRIPQGVDVQLGDAVARVVDMELSPISLILNVEMLNPEGFEPLAGYEAPQGGGMSIDQDGNEVYYDYLEEPIEIRMNDFLGDMDNLVVTLKDGTVLDTRSGGGSMELNKAQISFSFDRILNVEDIASITYCGQTLNI